MENAHHVLLANRVRNIAKRLRGSRQRDWRGDDFNWIANQIDAIADEIDGPPPWLDDDRDPDGPRERLVPISATEFFDELEGRGSIELTAAGREYGRQLDA